MPIVPETATSLILHNRQFDGFSDRTTPERGSLWESLQHKAWQGTRRRMMMLAHVQRACMTRGFHGRGSTDGVVPPILR